MEIKTKHSIGDRVWTIYNSRLRSFTINCIEIKKTGGKLVISYQGFTDSDNFVYNTEQDIYPSREELMAEIEKED